MKVVGLITEYNPFHNGHLYHLQESKRKTGADYAVVVMSGNFVQRGAPAAIDKFNRTKMALAGGADLVLELPVFYSCASAEFFASAAVALLDKLGVVDSLCFGSECGDIGVLTKIAKVFLAEPDSYRRHLKEQLKKGRSFPIARMKAFFAYYKEDPSLLELDYDTLKEILSNPNNILGIEYIKALIRRGSSIEPVTIQRAVSGYHDEELADSISSASAIRKTLLKKTSLDVLRDQVPDPVYDILSENYLKTFPIVSNDFSALFQYKLITASLEELAACNDVGAELASRIMNNLPQYESFDQFCDLIKTRHMTRTRVHRALLHILLDIKDADMKKYVASDFVSYLRVLGFKRDSSSLLNQIKKSSSLPLVTKLASAGKLLSPQANEMLHFDILTSQIYHTIVTDKYSASLYNEYTQNLIIV